MVRTYAQTVGIVIILIGLVGLIAGEEPLLGLINVEIGEDIVHLLTGAMMALGILAATVASVITAPARTRAA